MGLLLRPNKKATFISSYKIGGLRVHDLEYFSRKWADTFNDWVGKWGLRASPAEASKLRPPNLIYMSNSKK
jgi:hypothetical protein